MTMHIAFLCATRRGLRCLETVARAAPDARLTVFSFEEDPWEPPFRDAIRAATVELGGTFHETRKVGADRWRSFWDTPPDLALAVSWRYMIPPDVYTRPPLGMFVFHDSLLPAYRGFSPTVWAMVNGETETGVTLFEMAETVDSGPVVAQERVAIGPEDVIADVMERVTEAYLALIRTRLPALRRGDAPRAAQDESKATYTCKRLPEDNRVDWTQPARAVHNLIRAVSAPYPGAFTTLGGETLRVWAAERLPDAARYVGRVPGRVLEVRPGRGTVVLAGDDPLLITRVQREDGPVVSADAVLDRLSLTLGR